MAPATAARVWWLWAGSEPRGQNSPGTLGLGFPIRWLEVSRQTFGSGTEVGIEAIGIIMQQAATVPDFLSIPAK